MDEKQIKGAGNLLSELPCICLTMPTDFDTNNVTGSREVDAITIVSNTSGHF